MTFQPSAFSASATAIHHPQTPSSGSEAGPQGQQEGAYCADWASHHPQTPSSEEEGAYSADAAIHHPQTPSSGSEAGPQGQHEGVRTATEHQPVLTPHHQAAFLENLAQFGNVRLACRAGTVSPQTAYRARRQSPGFARAWDAALLVARTHAEQVLADRALNGVEEPVFFHGEEVARRRRFDSRLLLAHLARLDRLEERADVSATLPLLDAQIEGLRRGIELPEELPGEPAQTPPENLFQDSVPCVPSRRNSPDPAEPDEALDEDEDGYEDEDEDEDDLGPADFMWLGNRLDRMDAARPRGSALPRDLGDAGEVEMLQLEAFEAGLDGWWLVTCEEELDGEPRQAAEQALLIGTGAGVYSPDAGPPGHLA